MLTLLQNLIKYGINSHDNCGASDYKLDDGLIMNKETSMWYFNKDGRIHSSSHSLKECDAINERVESIGKMKLF